MKHTLWIKIAAALQLLTAAFHSLSFIAPIKGTNTIENQTLELMRTPSTDTMMGSTTSMMNLFTSMSAAFALLLIFGGLLNFYLLKKADAVVLKGVLSLQVLIFGILFAVCADLTFLIPIVCTGLVFIALLVARLTFPKQTA